MSRVGAKLAARENLNFVLTADGYPGAFPIGRNLLGNADGLGQLLLRPVMVDEFFERHARESKHLSEIVSNGLFFRNYR